MSLATEIQRDLQRAHESDVPGVLTFSGHNFPCSISSLRKSKMMDIGGAEYGVTFSIVVRLNAVATNGTVFSSIAAPKLLQDIEVKRGSNTAAETYTIVEIDYMHDAALTLTLHDPRASK